MAHSSTFTAVDGDDYQRLMGRWSRRLAEPFLDFSGLEDAGRVLDVGCGTGALSAAVAARTSRVEIVGLDLSPAYVAHAAAHVVDPRVRFGVGDACDLPVEDGAFDRAFCQLVLQFVPEPARAVAELRRVVRPGGVAAAAVWDVRGGFLFNRIFFDTAAMIDPEADALRARNFIRPMTRPGELGAAWRQAGFADVRETMLTIRMEFADFDDYWRPLLGREGPLAAYLHSLAAPTRDRIEAAVRRAFLDGDPDGPRSYAAVAWAVAGRA